MILMALDHASLFVAHRHGSEFWQGPWTDYTSALLFLTRFVTHLCAPGFFLLMGSGMYLFASSRRDQGWSEGRITRYFLLRGALLVLYPLLPWLGLCGAGIALGRALGSRTRSAQILVGLLPLVGLLLIAAALGVRYAGGFGNLRLPRHPGWMEFPNFIKYPPALPFVLFMLGTNLVLLGALRRRLPLLATFGQAPLCFYFVHLYLYATLAALFFRRASSLPVLYAVWLLGLVPLYVICQRFRRFKETKPAESLWRLF